VSCQRLRSGNIIAKDNDDEAGFIEDVTITDKIEVKGAFLSKLLVFRVVNFLCNTPVSLQDTVNQLIRGNFIDASADRVIPGLRIAAYNIAPRNVLAKIENGSLEQWLENLDVGFKVAFDPIEGAFVFSLYDGAHSGAVFCESFRNIADQQYYKQTAGMKNICIVEGAAQVSEFGTAQGLARREAYLRAGNYDPAELAAQFLRQNDAVETLDVKIVNPYLPFEYKKDYDLGDVVTIISEDYGVEITKNILELTEFFDHTGFHLYMVFGSMPHDLLTELRDKDNRLEVLEKAPEPYGPDNLNELVEETVNTLLDETLEDILDEKLDETLDETLELLIPGIVDEVFDKITFPPLPEYLDEDALRAMTETIVEEKLAALNAGGGGNHIILDHLPVQAEIDTLHVDDVVLVYNPSAPYVPTN
jgi:hypothetical protein